MNARTITYLSWIALAVAIASWAGVVFLAWSVMNGRDARAAELETARQHAVKHDVAVRLHALVQDTVDERSKLDAILGVGVVAAADAIEAAGKASGVKIELSGAVPEVTDAQIPGTTVQGVGFALAGDGPFSSLVHALELFESVPLPARLTRYDLERVSSSGGEWTMHAYVKMITTAEVSP